MSSRRVPFALALSALAASVTWSACGGSEPACRPAAETCNGLDDDCDGQVDDGFDVGAACSAGVGACARDGQRVCAAGGAGTLCDAVPGTPSAETCNQVDDDCDGQTDQDLPDCCQPAATRDCGVDRGVCQAGLETCSGAGAWGPCLLAGLPVILPGTQAEGCNGLDDDCDGDTDEPDAAGCVTYFEDQDQDGYGVGPGACLCAAAAPFTATQDGDCDDARPGTFPGAAEGCNGADDDCDGQTDEGFGLGASCTAGLGICAASGVTICSQDGSAAVCDAVPGIPGYEDCNGIDDDCDGQIDDEVPGPNCEKQAGVCAGASKPAALCQGATWVACTDATYAAQCFGYQAVETACDDLDNDCDGQTDEPFPVGAPCSEGVGACLSTGRLFCTATFDGVECQILAPGGTPSPETCNGIDDDCDGTTDEGLAAPPCANQMGVCAGSRQACGGAAGWLACGAAQYGPDYQAVESLCDGKDNDCDGLADEPFPVGTLCSAGVGACLRTGTLVCAAGGAGVECPALPGSPSPETCNGLDDDCDGQTDESLTGPYCEKQGGVCAGAAKPGVLCQGGVWVACTDAVYAAWSPAYQPSETTCDGRDNDCDGQTDEGNPGGGVPCDGPDTDLCAEGATVCAGGVLACGDNTGSTLDLCNGLDDDCDPASPDGSEDPQVGTACDGPDADFCFEGTLFCGGGTLRCSDDTATNPELCANSLDDDCDGQTDEPGCI